jgi:beta-lactamase class A
VIKSFLVLIFSIIVALFFFYKSAEKSHKPSDFTLPKFFKEITQPYTPKSTELNLQSLVKGKENNYALYVKNLRTDKVNIVNGDKMFYGASLFKIPVAISILQQVEKGVLEFSNVENQLIALLKQSDNASQDQLFPLTDQKVVFTLMPDINRVKITEAAQMFEGLYEGDYLNEEASALLLNYMTTTSFDDRVHSGLKGDVLFAHKIGNWPDTGTWHDCGVLMDAANPTVLCIMSENVSLEDFIEMSRRFGELVSSQ